MELMQPRPRARPASAAEVMERLSRDRRAADRRAARGLAGVPGDADPGRPRQRARAVAQELDARAATAAARALLIEGAAGVGRSRLLDACVLEAKLLGAIVLRADAADAQPGDYGVVRALGAQLLEALPEAGARARHVRARACSATWCRSCSTAPRPRARGARRPEQLCASACSPRCASGCSRSRRSARC